MWVNAIDGFGNPVSTYWGNIFITKNQDCLFDNNNKNTVSEFELYDMMGRLIQSDNFSDNLYRLEHNGLSSGTYLFRFKNEKGLLTNEKLVIQ